MTLAGCIGDDGSDAEYEIAIISSSAGFDDNAFNDNALDGLQEAADEYDIGITEVQETDQGQYESQQAELAEEETYDLIVCVSDEHTDALSNNAPEYEDQNWMLINNHIEGQDNVSGWIEMNNEMSFLAGVAAAVVTEEEIENADSTTDPDSAYVGFVGGEENDLIQAFETSFEEGAEWVTDGIDVAATYAGSFNDTSAAEDVADSQYEDGVDVIYHAASAAGGGVFESAQNNGRFAIGVDVDQSVTEDDYADVIVGSAVKHLNEATNEVATAVAEDDWESVSGEQNLTTEDEGIDFVIGTEFEGELDAVESEIESAKEAIINGDVELTCGPTGC